MFFLRNPKVWLYGLVYRFNRYAKPCAGQWAYEVLPLSSLPVGVSTDQPPSQTRARTWGHTGVGSRVYRALGG